MFRPEAWIPGLWIAWGLYWLLAAKRVKAVARQESVVSRSLHIVPLIVAGYLLTTAAIPGWLGDRWLPRGLVEYLAGLALVVAGLAFTVWARVVLGGNWSGTVTLKHDHEIVTAGPYRLIRHPIYTGLLVAFLGSAIARGEWRGLVAVAIVAIAFWRKLGVEERWLEESFGSAYADYRRRTWALIPYVL